MSQSQRPDALEASGRSWWLHTFPLSTVLEGWADRPLFAARSDLDRGYVASWFIDRRGWLCLDAVEARMWSFSRLEVGLSGWCGVVHAGSSRKARFSRQVGFADSFDFQVSRRTGSLTERHWLESCDRRFLFTLDPEVADAMAFDESVSVLVSDWAGAKLAMLDRHGVRRVEPELIPLFDLESLWFDVPDSLWNPTPWASRSAELHCPERASPTTGSVGLCVENIDPGRGRFRLDDLAIYDGHLVPADLSSIFPGVHGPVVASWFTGDLGLSAVRDDQPPNPELAIMLRVQNGRVIS